MRPPAPQTLRSFDVIVVGGGPAGLGVAAELARHHDVLVLERRAKVGSSRSWFVPNFVLAGNHELRPFLYPGVKRLLTKTLGGAAITFDAKMPGGYSYLREHALLAHWAEAVAARGSRLHLGERYVDHRVDDRGVTVQTSRGTYRARLLVDASGHDSPVAQKYRPDGIACDYWWSVFGCIAEHPSGLHDMQVGDYMLWQTFAEAGLPADASLRQGRPVFEYEILSEGRSFPLILYLTREKVPAPVMRRRFEEILRSEPSTRAFHDVRIDEYKYGWYPSGSLSQKLARDRVAFIGDAGCWTTPCGWGVAFILNNYRQYAAALSPLLERDALDRGRLDGIIRYGAHQKHQIAFDALMTHFLAWAPASTLDRFIRLFTTGADPTLIEKVYTLTMTPGDLRQLGAAFVKQFGVAELLRHLPREEVPLLLKEAWYLLADLARGATAPSAPCLGQGFQIAGPAPAATPPSMAAPEEALDLAA